MGETHRQRMRRKFKVERSQADRAYDRGRRKRDPGLRAAAKARTDRKWRRLRALHLRAHPLCVMCEQDGRTTEATQVDHVVSIQERPDLAYHRDNLQSLCTHHHAVKSQAERRDA